MRRWRALLAGAAPVWDLPALLSAADPKASLAERNLWLVRMLEWLRHPAKGRDDADEPGHGRQPLPVLRLRHLLNVLDRNDEPRQRVMALLARFWQEMDTAALLADFGFTPRVDLFGELAHRLRMRVLPATPETNDLAELFGLLFADADDERWLAAIDDATLDRLGALAAESWPAPPAGREQRASWRAPFFDAIMYLASAVRASAFSGPLRQRMGPELLVDEPFRQLAHVAETVREHAEAGPSEALREEARTLRALLVACQRAAASVAEHLEEYGVSVDVLFQVFQLRQRARRIDELLSCVLSTTPARDISQLLAGLATVGRERRSFRSLLANHYSLLAYKVAERSAETGEHYITRNRSEYAGMLRAAAVGGAVLAATTHLKFLVLALGMAAFWSGFWAGMNYAISFVIVQLVHGTVATKQPAMTAPAMARKLTEETGAGASDEAVEAFVDEVAHLIRSQAAGIFGNLAVVVPMVLLVQLAWSAAFGSPLVSQTEAEHVLESITLLGPTAFFAAFTGVLLFASSLIAGWAENWFVWHRLDSALAWNPRLRAHLGPARAQRLSVWWRGNISGLAANVSLGFMLGIEPVLATFFGLSLEVRHVTLSTGQLAAALGAEGPALLRDAAFWWCVAGIAVTGTLNLGVSFYLAFQVALRSRNVPTAGRNRIYGAIRRRLRAQPLSFLWPRAAH